MIQYTAIEEVSLRMSPTMSQNDEIIEFAKDCAYLCNYIYKKGSSNVEEMAVGVAHLPTPLPLKDTKEGSVPPPSVLNEDQINVISRWVDSSKIVEFTNLTEEKFGFHTNFAILTSPKLQRIYVVYRGMNYYLK